MKVLILNQDYFTDHNGYLMSGIAKLILEKKYKINYFCILRPSQKKILTDNMLSKVHIVKVKVPFLDSYNKLFRLIGLLKFSFHCLFENLFNSQKYDIVICSSSHIPLLGLVALIIAKINKSKFIYKIDDVWPESEMNIDSVFTKKLLLNVYSLFDKYVCYKADYITVLSNDMINTINKRFSKKRSNILMIQNLPKINETKISPDDIDLNLPIKNKDTFRIIFTGNIGIKQGLESLIDAMHLLNSQSQVQLIILGKGAELYKIKQRAADLIDRSIIFLPYSNNYTYISKLIDSSDLGIVSLKKGVEKTAFPSKLFSYLDSNCPILCIAESDSDLSRIVNENNIGIHVDQDNPSVLKETILNLSINSSLKNNLRNDIQTFKDDFFSTKNILSKWDKII